ncbi:MAG: ABATE domain-containing protein [Chloroflexi bacterium]|nr:ABATE domain-containing protein [Chloroflexota bacterium]
MAHTRPPQTPRDPRPPTPRAAQAAGFMLGGEPLALDLADTLVTVTDPPTDLLADATQVRRFWELQAARLPAGAARPSPAATRTLRDAIRAVLDAHLEHQRPPPTALAEINAAASTATTSPRLTFVGGEFCQAEDWHTTDAASVAVAAAARSAIEVLTSDDATRLRRCANPMCSMLFVADTPSRQWCTPNICGNRARVARHYRRSRTRAESSTP